MKRFGAGLGAAVDRFLARFSSVQLFLAAMAVPVLLLLLERALS